MDDSKPPDTNVVRLHRNGDPNEEERQRLASTIFAEEDEVGTFSRGNLVPPPSATSRASDEPSVADPFFEELQSRPAGDQTRSATLGAEGDATATYFERLGSQTSVEMSQSVAPDPATAGLPGSAALPGELALPRSHRWRRVHGVARSPVRTVSILRIHVAAPRFLAALGALVVAGAALSAILGGGGHHAPAARRLATKPKSAASSHAAAQGISADLNAARPRHSVKQRSAARQTARKPRRHSPPKVHVVLAADRRATAEPPSSPAAVTPVTHSSSQTIEPSAATQQVASPAQTAANTSGSASTPSSDASNRPAFGANGTLGPGHSPNG